MGSPKHPISESLLRDDEIGTLERGEQAELLGAACAALRDESLLEAVFREGCGDLAGGSGAVDGESAEGGAAGIGHRSGDKEGPRWGEGGPCSGGEAGAAGGQHREEGLGFPGGERADLSPGLVLRSPGTEPDADTERAASLVHPVVGSPDQPVVAARQGFALGKNLGRDKMFGELGLQVFGKGKSLRLHEVLQITAGAGDMEAVERRGEFLHIDALGEILRRGSLVENIADADGGAAGQEVCEAERRSGEKKTGEIQEC